MKRAALILALALFLPTAALAAGASFDVAPASLDIGATYNGSTLSVTGMVPEGSEIVLRFTGAAETVKMKQKGKAMGLLWMNMNSLHFSGVPKVCLVESSQPLDKLGQAGTSLGLAGLAAKIGVEPDGAQKAELVSELLKLKRTEGLFRESAGAVKLGEAKDGGREFTANLVIPSRLSPGAYMVEVFAIKDGAVVASKETPYTVQLVGIPATMADLAFNHGAMYGILASVIAILAGLGIGLVFQSKEAH